MSAQYFLYSAEDFPAKRKPNRSFQDSPEYLQFNGFKIYDVKAHQWTPLPAIQRRQEFTDFTDKRGSRVVVEDTEVAEAINMMMGHPESPYFGRGVAVVDRATYEDPVARQEVQDRCEADNKEFRARVVSEYEAGLSERAVTGKGRGPSTPYEDECYKVLGLTRPNSADAIMAQRNPGAAFAKDIVSAIQEATVKQAQVAKSLTLSPEEEQAINARLDAGVVVKDHFGEEHLIAGDKTTEVGRPALIGVDNREQPLG